MHINICVCVYTYTKYMCIHTYSICINKALSIHTPMNGNRIFMLLQNYYIAQPFFGKVVLPQILVLEPELTI